MDSMACGTQLPHLQRSIIWTLLLGYIIGSTSRDSELGYLWSEPSLLVYHREHSSGLWISSDRTVNKPSHCEHHWRICSGWFSCPESCWNCTIYSQFFSLSLVNNWLEVKMWDDQGFPEFEWSQVPASLGEVTASSQPDSTASMSSWASSHCGQTKGLECRHSILMVSG